VNRKRREPDRLAPGVGRQRTTCHFQEAKPAPGYRSKAHPDWTTKKNDARASTPPCNTPSQAVVWFSVLNQRHAHSGRKLRNAKGGISMIMARRERRTKTIHSADLPLSAAELSGLDFMDFLHSGETHIDAFSGARQNRRERGEPVV
jgi:hypothetical protein